MSQDSYAVTVTTDGVKIYFPDAKIYRQGFSVYKNGTFFKTPKIPVFGGPFSYETFNYVLNNGFVSIYSLFPPFTQADNKTTLRTIRLNLSLDMASGHRHSILSRDN